MQKTYVKISRVIYNIDFINSRVKMLPRELTKEILASFDSTTKIRFY